MKLLSLNVDEIMVNSNQPRKYFDEGKISELAESIKNNGLIQPVTVRKTASGKYEIVAGERRYRACRQLGIDRIPAIEVAASDMKGYELALIENIQRVDLNPVEEAESYLMLMEIYGYTQEKLADKLGKTRSSLSNKLRILKLPLNVKEMLKKGEISYGHARTLLGLQNTEKIEEMAMEIIKNGYSVREVEKKVKILLETKKEKSFGNIDKKEISSKRSEKREVSDERNFIEDNLRKFFESSVHIKGNLSGEGKIEISFSGYEELERIIGLLNIEFE